MIRIGSIFIILIIGGMTLTLAEERIPLSMLPKSAEMEIALRAYLDATDTNLLAEVSIRHTSTFTLGIDVPEVGKKGDVIQQMEFRHLEGQVYGLILVDSTSKRASVIFPKKTEKKSPNSSH